MLPAVHFYLHFKLYCWRFPLKIITFHPNETHHRNNLNWSLSKFGFVSKQQTYYKNNHKLREYLFNLQLRTIYCLQQLSCEDSLHEPCWENMTMYQLYASTVYKPYKILFLAHNPPETKILPSKTAHRNFCFAHFNNFFKFCIIHIKLDR